MRLFSRINKKNDKTMIRYEQIVAGALTKLEEFDDFDLLLITKDLKKSNKNLDIFLQASISLHSINEYVDINRLDDTKIKFKDGITLNKNTENGLTVLGHLKEVAGKEVTEYFEKFNVKEHKKRKEEYLKENRQNILDNVNVLFISNNGEDINAFREIGYKNVNYFKSIIRADKYFKEHPNELENYHLVILGNQEIDQNLGCYIDLSRKLKELNNNRKLQVEDFYNWNPIYCLSGYSFYLSNFLRSFVNCVECSTNKEVYEKINEQMLLNNLLIPITKKTFIPIKDYINPQKIPFPGRKEEIKILFCEDFRISESTINDAKALGLKIDFLEDNNSTKEKLHKLLGEYDIIVVSNHFSGNIINTKIECAEQCKDTGRKLVLLASYENGLCYRLDSRAAEVTLKYNFAGETSNNLKSGNKNFLVCTSTEEKENSGLNDYNFFKDIRMKAIMEEVVNLYNNGLQTISNQSIRDLDFKTAEEYNDEYEEEYNKYIKKEKEEFEKMQQELAPIKLYYEAKKQIITYLKYQRQGLVSYNNYIEGLNIINKGSIDDEKVIVENLYNGRVLCTVEFTQKSMNDLKNFVSFNVQTSNSKGNIEKPQTIALYTSVYKDKENIAPYANEKQFKAIEATCKKIINTLTPINNKIYETSNEIKKAYVKKHNNKKRKY